VQHTQHLQRVFRMSAMVVAQAVSAQIFPKVKKSPVSEFPRKHNIISCHDFITDILVPLCHV